MKNLLEDREQLKYPETIKGLSSLGFYKGKSAQGQCGFTREYIKNKYNYWETISFSDKKLYVYKQLNPWSTLFKCEKDLSDVVLNDYKKIIKIITDIVNNDEFEGVSFG